MLKLIRNNRGAALVEFAIVALLLFILVFGIIEFGMGMKDYLSVSQGAREGARSASLGDDVANIPALVKSTSNLDATKFGTITISWCKRNGVNGPWVSPSTGTEGAWDTITSGAVPTDPNGVLVKVEAIYNHSMVTGFFGSGPMALRGTMDWRRE